MFNKSIFFAALLLFMGACSSTPPLKGVDGGDIPPAFAHFPDIPFPERSEVDLNETRALGSGENWIGSLCFVAPYSQNSVFDFYMSEMPKLGWTEVAIVRAKISHMTYIKGHKAVQILVESTSISNNAKVTITAIPNKSL